MRIFGGIGHFEEPIASNNLFGLREVVKSLKIPISFGEYEKLAVRFKEVLAISKTRHNSARYSKYWRDNTNDKTI